MTKLHVGKSKILFSRLPRAAPVPVAAVYVVPPVLVVRLLLLLLVMLRVVVVGLVQVGPALERLLKPWLLLLLLLVVMVMVVSGGGGAGGGRREQWGLHHLHQGLWRSVLLLLLLLLLLVSGRSKRCGHSGSSYRHQRHWLGLVGVGHRRRLLLLLLLLHLLGLEVNRRGDPMCCSHRSHRGDGGQHCT